MRRLAALLLLLLPPAQPLSQPAAPPRARPLVFTHVTVIDTAAGQARPDQTVVIFGDRITALAPSARLNPPEGARVVDAGGKFLIPGLWDMHVHVGLNHERFFPMLIANGVTGMRDMAGSMELVNQWRREIARGALLGPRIVMAGLMVDGPTPLWPGSVAVAAEPEAGPVVASLRQGGVDFVKVYSGLPRGVYFAVAAEARRQGLTVAGHVPDSVSAAEASDAGQRSIEHLTGILLGCSTRETELRRELIEAAAGRDPRRAVLARRRAQTKQLLDTYSDQKAAALFARFARNSTWHVPTLTTWRAIAFIHDKNFRADARQKYILPSLKERWQPKNNFAKNDTVDSVADAKRRFQKYVELVGTMRRAGVEFMAGTDAWNPYVFPGFSLHDELALLVKAGLTPLEALQTATLNPARYLGRLDSLGTVEEGKLADLVLLEANPLEDISHTQKIAAVVVGGKLLDGTALQEMLARMEVAAGRK